MDLHVVGMRFWNDQRADDVAVRIIDEGRKVCEEVADGTVTYAEAAFRPDRLVDDRITNLGTLGGAIADEVAAGARAGKRVVALGSNCTTLPGILGGLQEANGLDSKLGLVWFDAHGDFNTPRTTLSGMLGGMPVAVSAGLCYPTWREASHLTAPIPTDRIVMVDVRNLDAAEEQLIRATDVQIAQIGPGFAGDRPLADAVAELAARCDAIYLHIDSDILDASLTPNHGTKEPNGPDVEQTVAAIRVVLDTGKVIALGLVSVNSAGEGGDVSLATSLAMLRGGLEGWRA
ncbi:MAG: Arginase [uncultured Thermomicrobiales bacterium]|uniref:Arginase n=1 Tax=uncultured Thermomicrobiales bacterium TaxID=1645740 RepID=A0A6J4VMB3_9BACT|nr:MAG: Arginase [uncultured Thermomicrobiales bacterium]